MFVMKWSASTFARNCSNYVNFCNREIREKRLSPKKKKTEVVVEGPMEWGIAAQNDDEM